MARAPLGGRLAGTRRRSALLQRVEPAGGDDRVGPMARSMPLAGLLWLGLACAPAAPTVAPVDAAPGAAPRRVEAHAGAPGPAAARPTPPSEVPAQAEGVGAGPEPAPVEPVPAEPAPAALELAPGGPALEITRRVRTGAQPKSVTVSPDGTRLYVCNFGLSGRRNVGVYDAHTLERVGYVSFPGNAAETAVSADGAVLYASNFSRGVVEIVDAASLRVLHEVKVGHNPKWMVVDEARGLLYVSNWSSRTVSAVDLAERRVDHTLRTGRRPRGMALMRDGTLLVGAMWDHRVQVYAPGSTRPDREFDACENPRHLVLSPDQARLYVSCSGDRLVRWFDPLTGQVLGQAPTGLNPRTIDLSGDGRTIAVADFSGSTISVIDLEAMLHRTHAVARSNQIVGLAIAPAEPGDAGLRILATSWLTNELLELRPAAGS
jgi:DNA-binding beta-propeller fold protein YncE